MANAFQTVENHVRRVDETLSATEFKHDRWVLVKHDEGTQFLFRCAFLRRYHFNGLASEVTEEPGGEFIAVFTEHHRFHVFAREELEAFHQFKEIE